MADLKRQLGLLDSTMINVGTIIGSSIFLVPASIAAAFSGSFPTILVWVAGALVSLCITIRPATSPALCIFI